MGKLRVGERLSLADGSFATVTSINFELSPRTTGRWTASSTGSGQANQPCTGTFGTPADPQTGLFPVYNLIVADWHTYFAAGEGKPALVHNVGPCFDATGRPLSSSKYSVAYEAKLTQEQHFPGRTDKTHSAEVNRQLHNAISNDAQFAQMMEQLYPGITKGIAPADGVHCLVGRHWKN